MRDLFTTPAPFRLPTWAQRIWEEQRSPLVSPLDRMQFVIRLAFLNVEQDTGGPFGAGVFDMHTGALVALGINLVAKMYCSHAHAEMVALANAQHQLRNFDLGALGLPPHELVTSCEPCAMCFGAIPLSGIRSLICGARSEDAEAIGFDEGAKPEQWPTALENRGIAVARDVLRQDAVKVLEEYRKRNGVIYIPRRG